MLNKIKYIFIFFTIIVPGLVYPQQYHLLESTNDHVKIEFDFSKGYNIVDTLIGGKTFQYISGKNYPLITEGKPWLPAFYINLGIPLNAAPVVKILSQEKTVYGNKFILPQPKDDSPVKQINVNDLDESVYGRNSFFPLQAANIVDDYTYRYSRIIILNASPYQFNPVLRQLVFNKKIIVEIDFGTTSNNAGIIVQKINDPKTTEFINNFVVNKKNAAAWTGYIKRTSVKVSSSQNYWFNPNKNYYEIYLSEKGVYRVTYEQLAASGLQMNNVPVNKLELINEGEQVPILINDSNKNGLFDAGDYFEFVGYPAKATPYAQQNIYNNDNVYFFSTEADSSGLRYTEKDGYPNKWDYTYQTCYENLHFEKDSLYENLGYAGDDHRDFWLWDDISGSNGAVIHEFEGRFLRLPEFEPDSTNVTLKVQLQGLTNNSSCYNDHRAYVSLNDQLVGSIVWKGQDTATFEQTIQASSSAYKIYYDGNLVQVKVTGDGCPLTGNDEVAVNWFELGYWKDNRADTSHFEFSSPPNVSGKIRFWMWRFMRDSLMIFIPQKNELIKNADVLNDQENTVLFVDSVSSPVEYFCAGYDYFLTPDSIIQSVKSDLRNVSNGADYIIIAHPDFKSVAERLANFRQNNFPDSSISNPRIKIVYVNQIYNEFSNGLLDPNSIRDFVKYAFDNWQKPSPSYVVLLGDMSHDYRHVLTTSRPSFVPSIPYYTYTFGEGVSDNMIAAVSGDDIHPDLAIGRLSCETTAEGNVLVDKLINYPQDNSKAWKQNVLLISSGLSLDDEIAFGLNTASVQLESSYLIPNGIHSTKIMRYPEQPDFIQYQGGGPEIRNAIDQGAALVNYYGHGGGYQWDLTFLNDDIYLLNNGGRLPLILSVTCYTAHFDDQDVFGEQFNKVEGKGSIGFFGNFGLTYWNIGTYIDNFIFDQIFNQKDFISGNVFQFAKNDLPATGYNTSQIALLTYLGDPVFKLAIPDKPDFQISSSDILFGKENAVVNDTLNVKLTIHNLGVTFPGDTVVVQMFVQSPDTSYQLTQKKLSSFGLSDSVYFTWIPQKGEIYTLTAKVNLENSIPEVDLSDNIAATTFAVYNLNNPNIIFPVDGFTTQNSYVDFRIADIGYYISSPLEYVIQIDTSLGFTSPISSGTLNPNEGLLNWRSPILQKGIYFWRTRIYDGKDSSSWSQPRTFSLQNSNMNGYNLAGKQLSMLNLYNMNVTDSGLVLNTNYIPPRPSNETFLEDIFPSDTTVFDSVGMTSITTDGKFIYFGLLWYYALGNNSGGNSKIYKIGTGSNGTIKGQFYGTIPNFFAPIRNAMSYYHDGYIYVATGDPYSLLRVDRNTGDTLRINIPEGMLRYNDSRIQTGSFYLAADSSYVYDLTLGDSLGDNHYLLRTFDPAKNWALAKPDMKLSSSSYSGFSGFFVSDGYLYPYENYENGYMRRIRLADGYFEEEWITYTPFGGYYGWCYDFANNFVYASVYRKNFASKISKFKGRYFDASGTAATNGIGPASKWNSLSYSIENFNPGASYSAILLAQNAASKSWDTLKTNLPSSYSISGIDSRKYEYVKLNFNFIDSSLTETLPAKLKSVSVNYTPLPDISITKDDIFITPDSVLQGLPINVKLKIHNNGLGKADSAAVRLSLNTISSPFYANTVSIPADSSVEIDTALSTSNIALSNNILANVSMPYAELYSFNNSADKNILVIRDSSKPSLQITFDGKEILSGDIVSSKPEITFTLKDNGALPIDRSDFLVSLDDNNINFDSAGVIFSSTPYPNSQATVKWKPALTDGKHTITYLAKDPSGNFSDSVAHVIEFYVYNKNDIQNVFNYPNPFKQNTSFTFQLTGDKVPDEFTIKIYTVAGRLIRSIEIPSSDLQIGFNKIFWDGRDEDGDQLANGVYFYKFIIKNNGVTKSVIQKMAKVL